MTNPVGTVTFSNYDSSLWTISENKASCYYNDSASPLITLTDEAGHSITGGKSSYYGKRITATSPAMITAMDIPGGDENDVSASVSMNASLSYTMNFYRNEPGSPVLARISFLD